GATNTANRCRQGGRRPGPGRRCGAIGCASRRAGGGGARGARGAGGNRGARGTGGGRPWDYFSGPRGDGCAPDQACDVGR
ncbi:MAG: hypothetical protein QOF81_3423, partial [Acidimicrobiaceae bacterium]|nr:hypothetical protein [Acidimicrobiaceae bacterium]